MYARSIHNVTIHRATQVDDPNGRVACGAVPRYSAWYGPDRWIFYPDVPPSDGGWEGTPPADLLCKRCFRAATKQAGK